MIIQMESYYFRQGDTVPNTYYLNAFKTSTSPKPRDQYKPTFVQSIVNAWFFLFIQEGLFCFQSG